MTELETHIEKKIPFALYNSKEGDEIIVFPAEKRFVAGEVSAVMKSESDFDIELTRLKAEYKNFQSLRPNKNEKTN